MLRIITLALTFLIRLRFPPRLGFVQVLTNRYGPEALSLYRNLEKLDLKLKKTDLDLNFLLTCKRHSVIPKFLYFKTYNHNIRSTDFYKAFQFRLLDYEIRQKRRLISKFQLKLDSARDAFKNKVSFFDFTILNNRMIQSNDTHCLNASKIHHKKLSALGISPDFKIDPDKVVINLSKRHLSLEEKNILAHGPNFALPKHSINFIDHYLGFEKLLHTLKPKSLPLDSNLNWQEFSRHVTSLAHSSFRDFADLRHTIPKLPPAQMKALKDLREDDSITICKPDKGKGFVIMDKQEYISKVEAILNDTTKFTRVLEEAHVAVTKVEDKLINFLRTLKTEGVIPNDTYKQLFPSGSAPGTLYSLPKIHKSLTNTPVRPILSAIGTYNYDLAKFCVPLLDRLTRNEYTIKDSFDFVSEVTNLNLDNFILASFDIESLFTSIPLDETIDIITESLFKDSETFNNFNKAQFTKFLNFAVKDSPFYFNGKLYIQKDGMAMGSPLGPTFANCFLCYHETKWVSECPAEFRPVFYRRFVDDTFLLFKDPLHIKQFQLYLNNKHSNIKFTVEQEIDGKLPFLDILLTKNDNKISTSVYRKPTFTGLGINFLSFVPEQFKENAIKTLIYRCYNICSDWEYIHNELMFLITFFQSNNFPLYLIYDNIKTFLNKTFKTVPTSNTDKPKYQYIVLPFYGLLSYSIRKTLHKLLKKRYPDTVFRYIFTNGKTISTLFRHKESLPSHLISKIVYEFQCLSCKAKYVGQTQRNLFLRTAEHMGLSPRTGRRIQNPAFSAVRSHSLIANHPFDSSNFKIIHRAKYNFDLLLLESLYIKHLSPDLNNQNSSFPLFTLK